MPGSEFHVCHVASILNQIIQNIPSMLNENSFNSFFSYALTEKEKFHFIYLGHFYNHRKYNINLFITLYYFCK